MSFSHTEAWLKALGEVRNFGIVTSPRGKLTREIPWKQFVVHDPMTFPLAVHGREFKDVIGILEGLSLVGEFNVPELFTDRVGKFARFMNDGVLWGAYGQRAHGSFGNVVELLTTDPDSRQAVVTFFDHHRDLNRGDKLDIPCTISAQFLLRNNELDLGISMRSNDLWLGTPYDLVQFSILQASVAQALGVRVGRYVHRAGSLHLYASDVQRSEGLTFRGEPAMAYPLWLNRSVGGIQERARQLSIEPNLFQPATQFERWARDLLLHG